MRIRKVFSLRNSCYREESSISKIPSHEPFLVWIQGLYQYRLHSIHKKSYKRGIDLNSVNTNTKYCITFSLRVCSESPTATVRTNTFTNQIYHISISISFQYYETLLCEKSFERRFCPIIPYFRLKYTFNYRVSD